ncbi:Flagellar motor switch protein FliM [Stieleria neptunia]|uniref:Flagellar motor switch protein FliM n=1 Tax=Stieleria neptunia TaxID=2527979 RepID=A0A518HTE0_9BACT|nr:FliM/FliN family flagellar motor switch protein [Stieleria neptunia]QDV44129.1 Flagellar motor switch protein FliM [Stieleria neptunia]
MSVRPFDFRDIAALDDTAVAIRTWISKSTSFFSDYWVEATGFSAKLDLGAITTESYDKILSEIPRHDLYCVADIKDRLPSVWYASADQFRIILSDLLCLPPADGDSDGDRDLSAIETDLSNYFINRVAESISRGWMGQDELEIEVTDLEKDARKLRLFRGKDLVTKVCIEIECKGGTATLNWLLPKQKLPALLDETVDHRAGAEPAKPSKELIGQLPLDVVTMLGSAKIPMADLAKLKPGELIVLDQRIDEPMVSTVDGEPAFQCWAGRLGNTQAVQVSKCLNK